jgi:hypothetical protein
LHADFKTRVDYWIRCRVRIACSLLGKYDSGESRVLK